MNRISRRLSDFFREVRIAALSASVEFHVTAGQPSLAHEAWNAMREEIAQRSPQQVERMERRIRG